VGVGHEHAAEAIQVVPVAGTRAARAERIDLAVTRRVSLTIELSGA
jgi:hypothetical protein